MATLGREPKISQTDSSTPSSRQGFFPVGTAAKKQSRGAQQDPSGLQGGDETLPGKRGHAKSDSFPPFAGGNDLFYSYPAESSENPRKPDNTRDRTDSGVAHEGPGGEEMLRSSSGSRFSILYPEEYSSGSAGSRRGQGQTQQFVSEQDLAALGMPLPIPAGRFDGEGDGARTPNSYRSAQSQLRFPVPPDRSREPSVLGQVGVVGAMEGVTRSVSADTSETRYHSLTDQANTLTRRSRSSATTADDAGDQPGVDEHGRRTGPAAVDGSYGTSSAIRNTSLAQTPVRTGMIEPEEHGLETTPLAGTSDRQPRPRLPLSALPSPSSTETPSSWTQPNRFSLIAGSISSLFGAKRASVVSSVTEADHDQHHQQAQSRRSTSGMRRNNSRGGENRQSYAGQPLVPEEVYREAFLSGIPEAARREARQESSGETRETFGSAGVGSDETGRRELSEGVTSEGDGSGETFGVKSGRDQLGASLISGPGLGERARVVTPSNRGNEAARVTRGSNDENPELTTRRIGEFGEVISGPAAPGREVLRLPGEMRKTSTLFIPGSPYSPAQASSQSASVQDEGSKSSSGSQGGSKVSIGTKRSIVTMRSGRSQSTNATGRTGRTGRSEMSEESGESLGLVSGLAPGVRGGDVGGRVDYSVAAVRGKRSMPQLVNTPDALAGNIPRTDTPPPATVSGPASSNAGTVPSHSTAGTLGLAAGALVEDQEVDRIPSTPPPRSRSQSRSRSTSGQGHVQNVGSDSRNRESTGDPNMEADEPLLPPQLPFVTKTREEDRSASPSRSSHSANSEKRREKEKWWLGRFGKDKEKE
ncbi:hypothetical protein FFLO_06532 [Filobasidium floriforme]|uniref:Uncharacterized protein n=1 Tax=Filobasidium floriforme TaxID=5210 RepID=A0A8K0NKH1_9TREE|nr:uncharacterized protein HD553DRAFT_314825 [Filobasidium floriforme]KAG7527887.1 hypothetical protein FFLO_06532 [Filobasidium floriforme]KAH8081732.1 hypothetical protein HD553DRAFT_314825 [Filobasidium floriforme]